MVVQGDKNVFRANKCLLKNLPFSNVDIIRTHGQFNNSLNSDLPTIVSFAAVIRVVTQRFLVGEKRCVTTLITAAEETMPTKKYLDKLRSLHDLDIFSLNTQSSVNPESNLDNQQIRSQYFSPHSFCKFRNNLMRDKNQSRFSILHNNVRSLRRNLENLQVHLLDELDYRFSVIGITETKITNSAGLDFNPHIPNYQFEQMPTPLSCGGVGMYVNSSINYTVLERTSNEAFQALWIELESLEGKNVICGVIYRQHNSPEQFQTYFDMTLERLSSTNKPIYVMGDFNIDLLKSETCDFSHNFLLSMQSYSFSPVIDKPTRVHNNSATLIDNILVNRIDVKLSSGNIVSDISDHYSQFCIIHSSSLKSRYHGTKIRDYSRFSEENFISDISQTDWTALISNGSVDTLFFVLQQIE